MGFICLKVTVGNMPGFPDLIAMRAGEVLFIEVKAPGRKPTRLQEYQIKRLRDEGFKVLVLDDEKKLDIN